MCESTDGSLHCGHQFSSFYFYLFSVRQVVDEQVLKPPDSFLAMTRPAQFAEEMQYRSMSLQKVISIFVRPLFPALNHSALWPFGSRQLSLIQTSYLCLRYKSPEKKNRFIQLNSVTFQFQIL